MVSLTGLLNLVFSLQYLRDMKGVPFVRELWRQGAAGAEAV